jgi:xanthine dehydrogenase large subunit
MLAISVREALRDAIGAFGAGGVVELASPATPEAVFWAIEKQRVRQLHVAAAQTSGSG